jgi:glycosyltransferase involved in cell wall biosynthesis
MTSPKVSVLIPTYNYARYLPEAIESVLQQDFQDFELLISDDCSSDGSAGIITAYAAKDSRIRFQIHPTNLGMVRHWNWCLAQARGEYVKFLLADDKLARPDALRQLVSMLEEAPQIVLASSSAQIINELSEVQFVRDHLHRDLVEDGWITCRRCLLSGANQIGEPSLVLFRRRCAGSGFNPAYRLWVDVEFALRVLEQGRFAYSAEPLASFRFHEGQQTRQLLREHLLEVEFYRLLLDFAERPWLGRKAARQRLFEEFYQTQKRSDLSAAARAALAQCLDRLGGRQGYATFLLRRKLLRPFQNLHRSLTKRLWPRFNAC